MDNNPKVKRTWICPQCGNRTYISGHVCSSCGHVDYRSGPGSRKLTKFADGEFFAFDGESLTNSEGQHEYVLLACSDGTYLKKDSRGRIFTKRWLDWLLNKASKHPQGIFVGFSFDYDVNMILRDLNGDEVKALWNHANEQLSTHDTYIPVLNGEYELDYLPRKYLKIRKVSNNPKYIYTGRHKKDGSPEFRRNVISSIVIWDVFGFFQKSFVQSCLDYGVTTTAFLEEMKQRRGTFTEADIKEMAQYSVLECQLLVQMMNKLRDAIKGAGYTINRWDGPGAIAAAFMRRNEVKKHLPKQEEDKFVFEALRCAYSGGRIEQMQYGIYEHEIYEYDIVSAYPSHMRHLPSLRDGEWILCSGEEALAAEFAICHVIWNFKEERPFYPFHYRVNPPLSIYYPQQGCGWQWNCVVKVALQHYPKEDIEIDYAYKFVPKNSEKPFAFIEDLFQQRKALKKAGNMAQMAIKLGLNSMYGKLAQQVGAEIRADGSIKRPSFFSLAWAGYITAATRAQLLEAALQHESSVIAFQTDCVLSTQPLTLDCGDNLGQWEASTYINGTFAQSGIYWMTDSQGKTKNKTRGFDKEQRNEDTFLDFITRDRVETAYREKQDSVTFRKTHFVRMGEALSRGLEHWCTWETVPKKLKLHPQGTKRDMIPGQKGLWYRSKPAYVYYAEAGEESMPTPVRWIEEDLSTRMVSDRAIIKELEQEEEEALYFKNLNKILYRRIAPIAGLEEEYKDLPAHWKSRKGVGIDYLVDEFQQLHPEYGVKSDSDLYALGTAYKEWRAAQ